MRPEAKKGLVVKRVRECYALAPFSKKGTWGTSNTDTMAIPYSWEDYADANTTDSLILSLLRCPQPILHSILEYCGVPKPRTITGAAAARAADASGITESEKKTVVIPWWECYCSLTERTMERKRRHWKAKKGYTDYWEEDRGHWSYKQAEASR